MATQKPRTTHFFITISPPKELKLPTDKRMIEIIKAFPNHHELYAVKESGKNGTHQHYHLIISYTQAYSTDNVRKHFKNLFTFLPKRPLYDCKSATHLPKLVAYMNKEQQVKTLHNNMFMKQDIDTHIRDYALWAVDVRVRRKLTFANLADLITPKEWHIHHVIKELQRLHKEGWDVSGIITQMRKLNALIHFHHDLKSGDDTYSGLFSNATSYT